MLDSFALKIMRDEALTDITYHNGNYYCVDSANTIDCGYETMVFHCDENGKITDWSDLYAERYVSRAKMEARHKEIVANIGAIVDEYFDEV